MSDPIQREVNVSHAEDDVLGACVFLEPDALDKIGIDARKFETLQATVADGEIEIVGGELRPTRELPEGVSLTHDEVPRELTDSEVEERHPDESPADCGEYYDRQAKRAFALHGFECVRCGETSPGELDPAHITPVEEFGDDELSAAHGVTNLQIVCESCEGSEP